MSQTLLPPPATPLERALESVAAERIEAVEVERLRTLWTPADCPAALLPWLAWALSVDEWDTSWSEATQRAVIAASVDVHQHKGTVGAVRRALAAAGYGDARLLEGQSGTRYDGTWLHDGTRTYGDPTAWALYRVEIDDQLSIRDEQLVRAVTAAVHPVRCHCDEVRGLALRYDGRTQFAGQYRFGGTVTTPVLAGSLLAGISAAVQTGLETWPHE